MKPILFLIGFLFIAFVGGSSGGDDYSKRVAAVTNTKGCVAFWDFVRREPAGARRFTSHLSATGTDELALEAGNYVRDYWGEGREAAYADFPQPVIAAPIR